MVYQCTRATISDLSRVRIVCKKCEGVSEFATDRLVSRSSTNSCQMCGAYFFSGIEPEKNPFVLLDEALSILRNSKVTVDVEFEWPSQ